MAFSNISTIKKLNCKLKSKIYTYTRGAMAGITQKSCVAFFPSWSLLKILLQQMRINRSTLKKFKVKIRNHVNIITAVTVIIISLITNMKIAIILIGITKSDYDNNKITKNEITNNDNNNRSFFEIN